jgi:heptosyltransferase-2
MGRIVNNVIKAIDKYILSLVCIVLGLFVRKSSISEPKNIIVIKLWAMGDSVNTLPLIKKIKEKNPGIQIDVLATKSNSKVYHGQEFIDSIIELGPGTVFHSLRKYDLALDFEPYLNISAIIGFMLAKKSAGFSGKTRAMLYNATGQFYKDKHITVSYLSILKTFMNPDKRIALPKIKYSQNSKKRMDSMLKKMKIRKPLIGFCPSVGVTVKEREWIGYKELSKRLSDYDILLVGVKGDKEKYENIRDGQTNIHNIAGMVSIDELFYLMERIDVFVSNDTGPMHLAAAQGVSTIGLFGPNTPKIWAPLGKDNISIYHPKAGCPFIDNTSHTLAPINLTDKQKTCMDAITVDEVYNTVIKLLKSKADNK